MLFVGPYRSSWDGLAQEEMWNQQWDHERTYREGLKEEKQVDKTWREEAEKRNSRSNGWTECGQL